MSVRPLPIESADIGIDSAPRGSDPCRYGPDTRSAGFSIEAHCQAASVAASERAADDQAFIDGLSLDEE